MARAVTHRYVDPLTEVWVGAAARIGLRVVRSAEVYAATDGAGTLAIGDPDTLDPDDSLAQMIFHELCHSLVAGEDGFTRPDWGLDNTGDVDVWREHATLRVQHVLAGRHGLAGVFAPTTDFRRFWEALPADPLADRSDPTVITAIAALRRVAHPPWAPALDQALAATAAIVAVAAHFTGGEPDRAPSLTSGFAAPAPHPTGLPPGPAADQRTCASCAWRHVAGPGRRTTRCRQADNAAVDDTWPGCERWEAALDCQACGACCREAYHAVAVTARDLIRTRRPDFVVDRGPGGAHRYELRRDGDRCAALAGGQLVAGPDRARVDRYRCVIYDDRPRTCREFTAGSSHCLTARRRVGLSL